MLAIAAQSHVGNDHGDAHGKRFAERLNKDGAMEVRLNFILI